MSRARIRGRPYPRLRRRYAAPVLAGKRIRVAAFAAAVSAVVLAGCGGGGSSTSTAASGEALSKQELIAKGDAICRQAREQFQQLQQNPPTTAEDAAALTQKLIDITESELSQLRQLTPPASAESSMDDYLKAMEKNVGVLKQGLKAAQQGDATGYAEAQAKTVSQQVERLQLARSVGFNECSRPAGTAPSGTGG
jgi:predicted transcriptional regulator